MASQSPGALSTYLCAMRHATLWLAFAAAACQGVIESPGEPAGAAAGSGSGGASGAGATAQAGAAASATAGSSNAAAGTSGGVASSPGDVNRVPLHRLNNTEYGNTMRDLLGVSSRPSATFIDDEKLFGFDNIAAAFGMTDARYEQYFNAADALVEEAFAAEALRTRIMICTPSAKTDTACARTILDSFAARAFRRPLTEVELTRLVKVASDAVALGEDFTGGIKQALKSSLASPQFLYRSELDPDPNSALPHRLGAYELASRLSYLVWSTLPDSALFQLAQGGDLLRDDVLATELARLLSDARSEQFLANFAGQWLGLRALSSHQVDAATFPDWNEPLREAMVQEGFSYFAEFLRGGRPITEFFTADVQFVNAPLAKLYGIAPPSGSGLTRVTNDKDQRRGFLGLAGFLTLTSFSQRTAPTLRGKWVLENLLCTEIPPPPADVPELDAGGASNEPTQNVRERLEAHRANPNCSGCHEILDPIGLGLESFDAIGRYRSSYANGDVIDATGKLPSGKTFNGLLELSSIVSEDTRLADCVVKKLMTYALSREIVASDGAYVQSIKQAWTSKGLGIAALLEQIVLSEPFRARRGEPR